MLSRLSLVVCLGMFGLGPVWAADAEQGKAIAARWCSSCHLVQRDQKAAATDRAPPFVTIAQTPGFDAGKLALLLLKPHPNMPQLSLSRQEIADLADYIRALPR
jgi:mono/diheme cytochrome c family protein